MPTFRQAQYEYALCYLEVIREADLLYAQGHQSQVQGIRLFELERVHIESAASLIFSDDANTPEWLKMGLLYATSGRHILRYGLRLAEYLSWLQPSLAFARATGDLASEAYLIGEIGLAHLSSEPSRAAELLTQELRLWQRLHNAEREQAALYNLGLAHIRSGNENYGLSLVDAYLQNARSEGNPRSEAIALLLLAEHNVEKSRYEEARLLAEKSLAIFQRIGDKVRVACALSKLTHSYNRLGNYAKALEVSRKALDLAREIGCRQEEARILIGVGSVLFNMGYHKDALVYETEALLISREIKDAGIECVALGSIGNAYYGIGDPVAALRYHRQRLAVARQLSIRVYESSALGDIGNAMAALGDVEAALQYYEQQLTIVQDIGYKFGIGNCLYNIACELYGLGRWSEAIAKGRVALAVYKEIRSPRAGPFEATLKTWEDILSSGTI